MSRSTIEVRFGTVGVDRAPAAVEASIGAAAARLGVDLVARSEDGAGFVRVGDIALADADPTWRVEAALLRALEPAHVLFLCVANSARSQLAEGIARALAPPSVRISSAGSEPTSVRPQAVRVLREIGIDISQQTSTSIDEVARSVDAVVTLCAEEACPVWLDDAWRLHWGLPDPAALEGSEEETLTAFRSVREELRTRLSVLFRGSSGAGWG